jgi:glyoxylase-like metal-dependent hydrolase (beta-lactamase superfamily II)
MSKLGWKLLIRKRGSSTAQGIPPGKEGLLWVSGTVTLIYGERDAVLVDTFLSEQHSKELLDWVVESCKNLTTVYITHAHGDHFFGLKRLLDKFPDAKAIATAPVVAAIRDQIKPEYVQSFWEPRFPGQLPSQLMSPEVLGHKRLLIHKSGELPFGKGNAFAEFRDSKPGGEAAHKMLCEGCCVTPKSYGFDF